MTDAPEFIPLERYVLRFNRVILYGACPFNDTRSGMLNRVVTVNGKRYRIAACEWFSINRKIEVGERVGFVLEPVQEARAGEDHQ
jgi:hypothetical protein